jgi:hypothetical protein
MSLARPVPWEQHRISQEAKVEMFLMALTLSLLGVAVSASLFAAATRDERRPPTAPQPRKDVQPAVAARFFAEGRAPVSPVPVEVLVLQLERHIRLEQAAAEAFLRQPTRESLHSRTQSPLVH